MGIRAGRPASSYFRAGYFSASDATYRVLDELGFAGGSLSIPGRVLPGHQSMWTGAETYPHRTHHECRLIAGEGNFINVPVSVAFNRPVQRGHAGERGYEWLYIPHRYDHVAVIKDMLDRFLRDDPRFPVIVTDSHNDQDYSDPGHPARMNLELISQVQYRTLAGGWGCVRRALHWMLCVSLYCKSAT